MVRYIYGERHVYSAGLRVGDSLRTSVGGRIGQVP